MAARYFTIEEANALVPTLEGLIIRIQQLQQEARAYLREIEMIEAIGSRPDGVYIMAVDHDKARQQLEILAEQANDLVARVVRLGCKLKDIDAGLVDFPALKDGEEVFFCWRLGESRVAYYHGLYDGYAGRKPLPTSGFGGC